MLLGNLIIFLVVIIVVCVVDLSSFSLDESTERLLYYDADEEASEGGADLQADGEAENLSDAEGTTAPAAEVSGDSIIEDAVSEIDEMLSGMELGSPSESVPGSQTESVPEVDWELQPEIVLGTQPEELAGQGDNVLPAEKGHKKHEGAAKRKKARKKGIVILPPGNGEVPGEHTQKRVVRPADTKAGIPVSSLDDSLGMSTDFDDDFQDISSLIREVHDGGSPS